MNNKHIMKTDECSTKEPSYKDINIQEKGNCSTGSNLKIDCANSNQLPTLKECELKEGYIPERSIGYGLWNEPGLKDNIISSYEDNNLRMNKTGVSQRSIHRFISYI